MHKLTFFPLGNADCCRIDLSNGKKILFDFAETRCPDDKNDRRCDLPKLLSQDLEAADRDYFDVVAFTHLDSDHIKGSTAFFWLEHDKTFQSKDRTKINLLWVLRQSSPRTTRRWTRRGEILQKEARYRFKQGRGHPRLLQTGPAQGMV